MDGSSKPGKKSFRFFLSTRRALALIAILGCAVRFELFRSLLESPLRFFARVPGLDMETLLTRGEWGVSGGPMLTPHRLMVAAFWAANGAVHRPEMIAAFQMLLGIITALLTFWCSLHLTRNRKAALVTGVLTAVYAPLLLYECVTLQESVVTFTGFLSFFLFLWSRKHHFHGWYGILCGAALGFAAIGRPTAILWALGALVWIGWYVWRKRHLRWSLFALGGFLFLLAFTTWFNWNGCKYVGPFFRVGQYAVSVNLPASAVPSDTVSPSGIDTTARRIEGAARVGINAASRIPLLFSVREIPENLNYYFLRERLWPLPVLPGPALLIPFALAGTLLALCRLRHKESIILGYIFLLALPLCAIYPVGRYRLMLIPAFAIAATYPFLLRLGDNRRRGVVINFALVAAAFLLNWNQFGAISRSTDFVAWALAREAQSGGVTEESCNSFYEAFRLSGGKNQSAAVNLLSRLIGANAFDSAEKIALQTLEAGAENPHLIAYYLGLIRMGRGEFAEAERIFEAIPPDAIEALQMKYHFFYGETLRLQGKYDAARKAYDRALHAPGSPEFAAYINAAKARLSNNAPAPK